MVQNVYNKPSRVLDSQYYTKKGMKLTALLHENLLENMTQKDIDKKYFKNRYKTVTDRAVIKTIHHKV